MKAGSASPRPHPPVPRHVTSILRTLIVDDEPLAREWLRELLGQHPDVQVAAECSGGAEAIAAIERLDPDLVFLDVQMPQVDGFDVAAHVYPAESPMIVFATAYDTFALRAFEASAVDYLLKPLDADRLGRALDRVRRRRAREMPDDAPGAGVERLLEGMSRPGELRERLALRDGAHFVMVRLADVLWVEADNNYVRMHTGQATYRYRATMAEMESVLDPRAFVRVHRSAIVNVEAVRTIEPWGLGEYLLVLGNGKKLPSSRRYRTVIRRAFGV